MSTERSREIKLNHSRCPFCHEEVKPDGIEKATCPDCLAVAHLHCWTEHGGCSACFTTRSMDLAKAVETAASREEATSVLVAKYAQQTSARNYNEKKREAAECLVKGDFEAALRHLYSASQIINSEVQVGRQSKDDKELDSAIDLCLEKLGRDHDTFLNEDSMSVLSVIVAIIAIAVAGAYNEGFLSFVFILVSFALGLLGLGVCVAALLDSITPRHRRRKSIKSGSVHERWTFADLSKSR